MSKTPFQKPGGRAEALPPRKELHMKFQAAICFVLLGGVHGYTQPKPLPETGFRPIFDGKTIGGWDCDPAFWRVENVKRQRLGETTKFPSAARRTRFASGKAEHPEIS